MESRYTWKNQLLNMLRNIAVTGGIILALVYLLLVSNEAANEEMKGMFIEEQQAITHIDEPVVYGYENGAKIWEVRSEVADTEKETESSQLERIYELILYKGGEENIHISGDHGDWNKQQEELTLIGNVKVESADGTTLLNTETLVWVERSKTLSCPEFVDFWVEDNHIIANSLYSDDDLVTIDFIGDVEMFVIDLKGENFVTREGDFPIEDLDQSRESKGMNILADYVHYDKAEKICMCYPRIPLAVQNKYKIDETGAQLPPPPPTSYDPTGLLADTNYLAAMQRSIAEMDLSPEMRAFLEGQTDEFPGYSGDLDINEADMEAQNGIGAADEHRTPIQPWMLSGGNSDLMNLSTGGNEALDLSAGGMGEIAQGMQRPIGPGIPGPQGAAPPAIQLPLTGMPAQENTTSFLGPEVTGPGGEQTNLVMRAPQLPRGDSVNVLTSSDYSYITGWEISPDLNQELFETDANFDPYAEKRDGFVFCYKDNKKFWCEELHIYLGDHRIEAFRRVDARFYDISNDEESENSRIGQAISESPTQLIGNYLIQNWETQITEGYGRILSIQPEKDVEADNFIYYEKSKLTQAWGDVIMHQYSGQWWETTGAIEDITNERAREDVRNPSTITCNAVLSYSKKVTWGFGEVIFHQEEQTIIGDRIQYEDANDIMVVAGNVDYNHSDGNQLQAALLTMDLKLDEYIAEGAAIARNRVSEEYQDNLDELQRDEEPKPEDDARARLLENRTASGLGDWTEAIENPPPVPPIEYLPDAERDEAEQAGAVSEQELEDNLGQEVGPLDLFSLSGHADETTSEGQDTSEGIQESGFNFEDAVINDFPGMYSIFPMVDPFDLSGGSTESSAISGQDGLSTIGTE